MAEGHYSIRVNQAKKAIEMVVGGTFTKEKAQQFLNDYNKQMQAITPNEYVLTFDCRSLDIVTQDMIPQLESCFKLYKETGFKEIIVEITKNPILKMQLSRLGRNTGLTQFKVQEV